MRSWIVPALSTLVLSSSLSYAESDRRFAIYGGPGLYRLAATIEQPGSTSNLTGWGNAVEVGMDVPLGDTFGVTVAGELGQYELSNSLSTESYMDRVTMNTRGGRAMIYLKKLYLGGGVKSAEMNVRTLSSSEGGLSASAKGNGNYAVAGFTVDHKGMFRASLELQASQMTFTGAKYTDYQVGIRFFVIPTGF